MPRQTVEVSHLLRAALDHLGDAVAITTAAGAAAEPVLLHANRAFAELTGYRPDELRGQPVSSLEGFHVGRSVLPRVAAALAAGRGFQQRVAQRQRNGRPYLVECDVEALRDGPAAAHWLWRLREVGAAPAETPEQRLFAHGPVVVFRWQARDRWPVEYVSPNVAEVCGYTAVDFMSGRLSYADIVYAEDWPRLTAESTPDGADEVSYRQQEYRIVHAFGGVRWLHAFTTARRDAQGRITHHEGYVFDVTDRHRSEEALRASEERFRALYEEAPIGISRTTPDGRILDANPACIRMLGFESFEELARRNLEYEGFAQYPRGDFRHRVERDGHVTGLESVWLRRDGTPIHVRENSHVVRDAAGRVAYYEGTVEDVTQRKADELAREATLKLLAIINAQPDLRGLLRELTGYFCELTGCAAVGVRLRDGLDFPYFETRGLPPAFVQAENRLCACDEQGAPLRDGAGHPVLECMCGNVLCGRFDPRLPFFTPRGSFWTNSTTRLLASTSEAERQARTRNRCHGEGYESVALIPLRVGHEVVGLVQCNDPRPDRFTPELIRMLEELVDYVAVAVSQRRALEALRAGEERFRAIFASAEDSIFIKDAALRYVQVNPAMARLFDRSAAELVGRTDAELFGTGAAAHIDAVDRRVLAGETVSEEHTKPVAGTTYTFHVIKVPMRDDQGRVCGLCGIARDVTARKAAEGLLRASHAELERRVAERTGELSAANEELRREIADRRLIEDELRDSQRLVQQINDTTPSLIYLYDLPTQHMVYANDCAGRFFGFDPGHAIEVTLPAIAQRVHPDDRAVPAQLTARTQTLTDGRVLEGEYRYRADDGTWRWLRRREVVFTRTEAGEPELVLGTALDVTALKRVEELLRVQRDLSHALGAADSLPQAFDRLLAITARLDGLDAGAVYLVDEDTGDLVLAAHRGVSVELAAQVARAPATSAPARLVQQGQPIYRHADELAVLAPALAAAGMRSVAVIPVRHGGRIVASLNFASLTHADLSETVRHALEVIAARLGGVIERVRTTEALRESRDLLQAVIDGTQDIVYVKDLTGRYRLANAAGAALVGLPLKEVLGKADAELLSPVDAELQVCEDRHVLETNAPVTFEHPVTIGGQTRHFLSLKAPQYDAAGRLVGIIGVSRDITDFKAAQEQLQRAARLASIGTFAAGIAHEINNPVGGILLAAEAALTDAGELQDAAFVKKCLTEIAEDARRCGRIVQSVLRFARQQPTERWPSDLNELVQRAQNLTRAAATQHGGEVALRLAGDLPPVNVNPTEFEQALINLIHNALEAGGGGTRVEVTTQHLPGTVRVAVADNGPGLTPRQREHIFDPFYTTRLESGGTGLGLSVVHGIVRAHGGAIDVGTTPHGGTTFTIDLPCSEEGGGSRVPCSGC